MAIICGAERRIDIEVGRGDKGGDVYISSVNGIPAKNSTFEAKKHWIGGSGHGLIAKCRRCVGNPNRECDLNTETWRDLQPQVVTATPPVSGSLDETS